MKKINQFKIPVYIKAGICAFLLAATLIIFWDRQPNLGDTFQVTAGLTSVMSKTHIPFIFNQGQHNKRVKFYANTFGGTVFITHNSEIVYALPVPGNEEVISGITIKETIVGAKATNVTGLEKTIVRVNYIRGNDPLKWQENTPTYNMLDFDEVYDGIELKLKAHGNNVEKLFYVKPGAKPENIKMKLGNVPDLEINESGELEIDTEAGVVRFTKPVAYQDEAGTRVYIDAEYSVNGNEYGFEVGDYNLGETLVIDPLLASTFIGGSSTDDDYEPSVATDSFGNVYISGYTWSADFPTTAGVYNQNFNGGSTDRFVSKFDNGLENLLASTFIGGTGNEYGMGLQVSDDGFVYLAGYTNSPDFPVTPGSYDQTYNGGRDAFILKLDNDLTTLHASTYLGGSGDEGFQWPRIDIVVDSNNNVYVAGITKSPNFPFTPGAFDSTYAGGQVGGDAFVAKLNSNLSALTGSTYLGGNQDEWRVSVALDKNLDVFVCGETTSSNFPTAPNSYDPGFNGGSDVFISKFTNDLSVLSSSTFIGANGYEEALSVKPMANGNIYLAGYTTSTTFPTTPNAYDQNYNGGARDAYIAKFNNSLTSLLASTFIGGNNKDTGEDMAINVNGDIYITGVTLSSNFPVTAGAYNESYIGGEDIFVSKLDSNLSILIASTFAGGLSHEKGQGIALGENANVFISGHTASTDFPVTTNAYDTTYNGGNNDCFIMKFDSSLSLLPTSLHQGWLQPNKPDNLNNHPNPFYHYTNINYHLTKASQVVVEIHNMKGQEVKMLVNKFQDPGDKSILWNGTDRNNQEVLSGIYYCTLKTGHNMVTRKIIKN
ncbi:MAG: hypothetical protein B6D64_01680 [Bacteroidetes bacterium 4484_276]|nr:MAG: hypothetical protein B6D64_01680 [Bacteroidetes bacterium 4484_276]OYT13204.1 MAG: hypothetical protein B6I19_06315 [Bacteroidetes bacterium 4572_114]